MFFVDFVFGFWGVRSRPMYAAHFSDLRCSSGCLVREGSGSYDGMATCLFSHFFSGIIIGFGSWVAWK